MEKKVPKLKYYKNRNKKAIRFTSEQWRGLWKILDTEKVQLVRNEMFWPHICILLIDRILYEVKTSSYNTWTHIFEPQPSLVPIWNCITLSSAKTHPYPSLFSSLCIIPPTNITLSVSFHMLTESSFFSILFFSPVSVLQWFEIGSVHSSFSLFIHVLNLIPLSKFSVSTCLGKQENREMSRRNR